MEVVLTTLLLLHLFQAEGSNSAVGGGAPTSCASAIVPLLLLRHVGHLASLFRRLNVCRGHWGFRLLTRVVPSSIQVVVVVVLQLSVLAPLCIRRVTPFRER